MHNRLPLTCLAFLLGIVATQHLAHLPDSWLLISFSIAAVFFAKRRDWPLTFLLAGMIWASLFGAWRLNQRLPESAINKEMVVEGYISNLPEQHNHRVSFDFVVSSPSEDFPEKIRLNWYNPEPVLAAGQNWRLNVKLKPPHGRSNPGGFDYEAWLFANRIGATGYVRPKPAPINIDASISLSRYFAVWRQALADKIDQTLPNGQQLGLIKALSLGSQSSISQPQWDLFRITGVIHLIVISGSHISLIAGLVYLWLRRGWAWLGILSVSPQQVAAVFAWLTGLFYAGLAGYTIPTLRAVIMLSVALAAIVWQRNSSPLQILFLALFAVLIFDPLAVLAVGFWLSFLAVALLIYLSAGRLGFRQTWQQASLSQLATTIGLAPLLITLFQQVSLISPLANWLAVPLIGLLIVPLILLAMILLVITPILATPVLWLVDQLLQGFCWLLSIMAELPLANLNCLPPPWYALIFALFGVLLMLAPKGFPCRYLSPFLYLPLLLVNIEQPKAGEVLLTLLDVDQGLSAVIQTQHHSLVFDTGAKFADSTDMGDAVLLPFLHHQGVNNVDHLIISHADNDHSGGAESLLAEMPVQQISSSAAPWAEYANGNYCQAGQSWEWDAVKFQILSPPAEPFSSENDNSCVLQISTAKQRFLLTGDIERNAEQWLVEQYGSQLQSHVLIAPHHGSKTSSSESFLQQVAPELILIPAGYLNRFHFPHPSVLARYQRLGADWLNTADKGAISLYSNDAGLIVLSEKKKQQRYWMTY